MATLKTSGRRRTHRSQMKDLDLLEAGPSRSTRRAVPAPGTTGTRMAVSAGRRNPSAAIVTKLSPLPGPERPTGGARHRVPGTGGASRPDALREVEQVVRVVTVLHPPQPRQVRAVVRLLPGRQVGIDVVDVRRPRDRRPQRHARRVDPR